MSDITVTTALVARVFPGDMDVAYNVVLASGVSAGQSLYQSATGGYALTDANHSGMYGFRGIALETQVASGVVSMLQRGVLGGYDLSGMNYDAPVYLSDTAGALSTAAGANSVLVGRVVSVPDLALTKVLYIDAEYADDGGSG